MVDKVLVLTHHFRNGLKICRLADEIGNYSQDYQPMEGTAQGEEKQSSHRALSITRVPAWQSR